MALSRMTLCFLSMACIAAWTQPYSLVKVDGVSMSPSLSDGEIIVAKKLSSPLRRGDVVVFHFQGARMVKRIMFLPGDSFPMVKYFDEWMVGPTQSWLRAANRQGRPKKTVRVPEGTVYVVGDNWPVSTDSRHYGPVPIANVESVVPHIAPTELGSFAGAVFTKS